ncbi:MAG: dihydropteroate synthase [Clostridia bacterium]|nr:dihydropteroate synthase [Clostridia bacterium]
MKQEKLSFKGLKTPQIMGILNITPDSFSDGGKYNSYEKALERALEIEAEGADFLDIGAQSTRPESTVISDDEELSRLFPVLDDIRQKIKIPVSIDTFYTSVAKKVLKSGVDIINDVSSSQNDEMLRIVKYYDAAIIIMHKGEKIESILPYFEKKLNQALKLGISKDKICFDPGIGFGKKQEDNIRILKNLKKYRIPDVSLLLGLSKKSFLPVCCNDADCIREAATIGANIAAVLNGVNILRVHNVKQNIDAINTFVSLY